MRNRDAIEKSQRDIRDVREGEKERKTKQVSIMDLLKPQYRDLFKPQAQERKIEVPEFRPRAPAHGYRGYGWWTRKLSVKTKTFEF